jgi:hypothetical protein
MRTSWTFLLCRGLQVPATPLRLAGMPRVPMLLRLVCSGSALQMAGAVVCVSSRAMPLSFTLSARLSKPVSAKGSFRAAVTAPGDRGQTLALGWKAWRARDSSCTAVTAVCVDPAQGDGDLDTSVQEKFLRAPALSLEADQLASLRTQARA